ncbi:MAG: serine/threonine-protein kinase [Pyrinomonadaceae bacterium]
MIETGRLLQDRYRIDRQIGQGGMGAVYVATDERFGSVVAIKETLCMDDNYRKAIEREARLLNSLKHNALPKVTDHFLESNGQFLVMEYIPGEDLCCILEERGEPFEVDQVMEWSDQLLEALEFLHNQENPVIHRDIKPQNLKVTPKGQIILLDFGLAKGNVTGAGNQTNSKSIFGYSRNYASLEQIQGTGTDPRSDLYSLAATIYHLLTNVAPEDALTRAMSVLTQKPDPLVPANQIRPEIPAGVAAIIHKALDLDAAQRPASAAEMRQMLRTQEDYAGLAVNTVSVARSGTADIHSQPTQLMPGATMRGQRVTDGQTNVVDEGLSQVTAIRPLAQKKTAYISQGVLNPGRTKKRAVFAIAAGLVVLVGAGIAGVVAYQEMSQPEAAADPIPVPVVETQTAAAVAEAPGTAANAAPDAAAIEASSANTAAVQAKPDSAPVVKKTDQARKTTADDMEADMENLVGPDDEVVVKGDALYVGKIKIKDGKVYMPDGTVHDAPRTPRQPGVKPPVPPVRLTEEQMRNLTPEQRRKLRIMRERYPGTFSQPTPYPDQ